MKLLKMIGAQPVAVAFGMRGASGQPFKVVPDGVGISLVSAGVETRLPAATQSDAGLLTAADKARLDDHGSRLASLETTSLSGYNLYYASASAAGGGDGSIGNPFTLSQAFGPANPGITPPAIVYLRGGVYLNPPARLRLDLGTAAAPLIYRAYPGETPILRRQEAVTWTKVIDEPGRQVYESNETFPAPTIGGHVEIDGAWYPLPSVSQIELEAAGQDYLVGGGYYPGPCICRIPATKKVRIRLDPPAPDAQLSSQRSHATTTDTDPANNTIVLENGAVGLYFHHPYTTIDGLWIENSFRGLRTDTAISAPLAGIRVVNCHLMPTYFAASIGGMERPVFDNNVFDGRLTPDWWVAYWDIKGGATIAEGTRKCAVETGSDSGVFLSDGARFTRNTVRNFFDGFLGQGLNTEIGGYSPAEPDDDLKAWGYANRFENIWDDVLQLQSRQQGFRFHHNICIGAGVSRDGSGSAADRGSDWPLIYRNILDSGTGKIFYGRKGSIDGDGNQNREGLVYPTPISSHGLRSGAADYRFPWHFISNTVILRLPSTLTGPFDDPHNDGINLNLALTAAGNHSGGLNIVANNAFFLDLGDASDHFPRYYWIAQDLHLGREDEIFDGNAYFGPWGDAAEGSFLVRRVFDEIGNLELERVDFDVLAADATAMALMIENYGQRYEAEGIFAPESTLADELNPSTYQPLATSDLQSGGVDLSVLSPSIPVHIPGRGAKRR